MELKELLYHKMRLYNVPTVSFYAIRLPNMLVHYIVSKITKNEYVYYEILNILNTIRIECSNYDTVNDRGKHSLKCKYYYNDRSIYIKVRFYRKVDETEYDNFRNSIDIHCDYGISNIVSERGNFHFNAFIKFEPIYEEYIDKTRLSIGTNYKGLLLWDYSKYPHLLVIGDTGQGKSVFIRYILRCIFKNNYDVWCVDGKKIDYTKVKNKFVKYVANSSSKADIIILLREFKDNMQMRYDLMVSKGIYNYFEESSLDPVFLLIDEYLTIIETTDKKEQATIKSLVSEIIWLGRAAGYFLIETMQRADTKYIDGAIRDNFACRVVVGKASKESYQMLFDKKLKGFKRGRGWLQINNDLEMISIPFYEDFDV